MFEVTVRDHHGNKIAVRIKVDGTATVTEVIEEARHQSRLDYLLSTWRRVYGKRPIRDWWLMKSPAKVQKQEPIKFDVLVDQHSI